MNMRRFTVMALGSLMISGMAWAHPDAAHVKAENAWVRASVPGQQASGAFMRLTAEEPLKLVGVETTAAGVAEVHEMKMDGDVMRMRALPNGLALPAGKTVALTPGGYHVMLMDLKATLPKDSTIPLTLTFKNAKGEQSQVELKVPVATTAPGAAAGAPAAHKH